LYFTHTPPLSGTSFSLHAKNQVVDVVSAIIFFRLEV
jgi:hypothetical protein